LTGRPSLPFKCQDLFAQLFGQTGRGHGRISAIQDLPQRQTQSNGAGALRQARAICSAFGVNRRLRYASIARPATMREYRSRTGAKNNQPSSVGTKVTSVSHFWFAVSVLKSCPNRLGATGRLSSDCVVTRYFHTCTARRPCPSSCLAQEMPHRRHLPVPGAICPDCSLGCPGPAPRQPPIARSQPPAALLLA